MLIQTVKRPKSMRQINTRMYCRTHAVAPASSTNGVWLFACNQSVHTLYGVYSQAVKRVIALADRLQAPRIDLIAGYEQAE